MTILEDMITRTLRHVIWMTAAMWLVVVTTAAAQKRLTLDDVYDPVKRVNFNGNLQPAVSWIDGTHFAWPRSGQPGVEWTKVDAATGAQTPLFDVSRMESALVSLPGVDSDEVRRVARSRSLTFNARYTAAILRLADDLYVYAFEEGRALRLTREAGTEDHPSFSPDGKYVAFVRANNLYVSSVDAGRETALTTDGTAKILNGRLDWVYEEEIYGRGESRAYWWSPDSSRIAFLRLDDTPVPTFSVVDHIPYNQDVEEWDYPKAGDANPLVKLGVATVNGGMLAWVDTSKYPATDHLVVRVGWTPDSRRVVYAVQNRTQTWLDLNVANASTAKGETIFRESSKFWIGADDVSLPLWLKDGSFLWLSDRSGWRHLYHFKSNGTLVRQVTSGKWELRTLHGVDETNGRVYFSGTERSHIAEDVYRVNIDGSGFRRLSAAEGTHAAEFGPAFGYYVDRWSNLTTPPQTRLHKGDGIGSPGYRRKQGLRARGLSALEARVTASEDARRLCHGSDDDQAARLRSVPPVPRVPVHIRRPPQPAGSQSMGRHAVPVSPTAGSAWDSRLGLR